MHKIIILSCFLLFGSTMLFAQAEVTWKDLQNVSFSEKFNDELGMYIQFPTFGEALTKMQGKPIQISGYIIPMDIDAGLYVLSANPFASCFFCGGGGPESVVTLKFKKTPKRYNTDEIATFEGIFKLNDSDIYELNYILVDAKQVKD